MLTIKYPLTPPAMQAARELVAAWDSGILPQTMLFGHYTQGKVSHPMFFDLNGNQINYDKAPQRGVLFEYAHFNLVSLRTFRDASTLEVVLMQELRNAVETEFTVSEYFLTINSAGVLNMSGGTVNISDSGTRLTAPNQTPLNEDADLVPTLSALLEGHLARRDDLAVALDQLAVAEPDSRTTEIPKVIAALGRALNDNGDDPQIMQAVNLLTRHMGGV